MPEKVFPTLPRFLPTTYDHTAFKYFKECHRKFFYRIVLGRTAKMSKYQTIFDFGKIYHKFREVLELEHMAGKTNEQAFAVAMLEAFKLDFTPGEGKYEFYNRALIVETCKAGYEHWLNEKKLGIIKVLAVEQPINVELGNGIFISGRADQIISWRGKIWGRDFKTTSKMQQYFDATLDPNDQPTRYIFMESKLHFGDSAIENGKKVEGVIFEVVQNTKTTKPKIYNTPITKTTAQLQQWRKEQLFLHKLLDICIEEDIWAMHETNCTFCDYHKVCKQPSFASMENMLKNDFLLSPWDHEKVDQVVLSESL